MGRKDQVVSQEDRDLAKVIEDTEFEEVVNTVMTVNLNVKRLDLDEIAVSLPDVEFYPEKLMAAVVRREGCTMLIYATGVINCTGRSTIQEKKKEARLFIRLLNEVGISSIQSSKFRVTNIASSTNLGSEVDLEKMARSKALDTLYEPEQFPVFTWHRDDHTVQVFGSGKLVLVGIKSEEIIPEVKKAVFHDLQDYRIE